MLEQGVSPEYDSVLSGAYGPIAPYLPSEGDGPVVPVPVVSRFQAKAALLQMGLLDQVETLLVGMDAVTRLAWADAVEFRRTSPLINALAPYLTWPDGTALTAIDIDALFQLAQSIEV